MIYPLYFHEKPIYFSQIIGIGMYLPEVIVERVHLTEKARLLRNVFTQEEAWFPETAFRYHWSFLTPTQHVLILSVSSLWKKKYPDFFKSRDELLLEGI